ncbi:MAG: hypothetical protein DRR08_12370 [Candidatus Parabeggiatoa sp. nov. 2]|nr:MAG: hypothetical protein B6247_04245 [Beggiatoa sp. 4572_84]RKZ60027.1 MAG: hypothetical protein DRR08_12370 [Gammaproteobacteria bacterium]
MELSSIKKNYPKSQDDFSGIIQISSTTNYEISELIGVWVLSQVLIQTVRKEEIRFFQKNGFLKK